MHLHTEQLSQVTGRYGTPGSLVLKYVHTEETQVINGTCTDAAESSSFCFLSNTTSSTLSFSNSFWQRFSSSLRKWTVVLGLSVICTLSWKYNRNREKNTQFLSNLQFGSYTIHIYSSELFTLLQAGLMGLSFDQSHGFQLCSAMEYVVLQEKVLICAVSTAFKSRQNKPCNNHDNTINPKLFLYWIFGRVNPELEKKPLALLVSTRLGRFTPATWCRCCATTYRGKTAAHVPIGHREAGLIYGLLKDQVNDPFEPLLSVDGQVRHLLHQLVELLRCELVQDAADLPEELLIGCQQSHNWFSYNSQTLHLLWKMTPHIFGVVWVCLLLGV